MHLINNVTSRAR